MVLVSIVQVPGRATYDVKHGKLAVKVDGRFFVSQTNTKPLVHALTQIPVGKLGDQSIVIAKVLGFVEARGDVVQKNLMDEILWEVVMLSVIVQKAESMVCGRKHSNVCVFVLQHLHNLFILLQ